MVFVLADAWLPATLLSENILPLRIGERQSVTVTGIFTSADEQFKEIVDVLYEWYVSTALKYLESSTVDRAVIKYKLSNGNGEVTPLVMRHALEGALFSHTFSLHISHHMILLILNIPYIPLITPSFTISLLLFIPCTSLISSVTLFYLYSHISPH